MKRSAGTFDVELGRRLRQVRLQRGLPQPVIGEYLGITAQQVQKYEQGIDRLSVAFLVRLRDLYQVPLDFFIPGTGPSARRVEFDVQAAKFAGDFLAISNRKVRRQLAELVRSLAGRSRR